MKTLFKVLLGLSVLFFWQAPALARTNATDWYVKDFQTTINVNQDSSLDITENILADCGTAPDKHGIFRVFPKTYKTDQGNFPLPFELVSITNGQGQKLKYSVKSTADTITYQIGDPKITVTGENDYIIKYRVKNVIRITDPNFDELYYNILGNFWDLEIDNFTASINFPTGINKDNTKIYFYTGALGSQGSDLVNNIWLTPSVLKIQSTRTILKAEGITLSASFPKNIMTPYVSTFKDTFGFSISDIILIILFPLLALIICFYLWKKYGRDIRLNKTIVPEFEIPEKLTPMEMGALMKKGKTHENAVTATIIRLGFLGYLTIAKVEQKVLIISTSDYKLSRTTKAVGPDLYEAEAFVLQELFGVETEVYLKDLKNDFYRYLPMISKKLLIDFKNRGYIDQLGEKYMKIMMIAAAVIIFVGISLASMWPIITIGLLISSFIVLIFSLMMGKLTMTGAELDLRVKGFKLYMNTAEKYRSQFQEKEGTLDKLLPYAILFGITTQWLKKMKDIHGEPYFNTYHPAFLVGAASLANFESFSSAINDISNSIASNISPSSSGAGGVGGAGGGAGGGGGGGW
jgi:uncharacterized membrane protein